MTVLVLGGASAAQAGSWVEAISPLLDGEGVGSTLDLSVAGAGPATALAQLAAARAAGRLATGDLVLWDQAADLAATLDPDALEAGLRPVETLLRACKRNRLSFAAMLSEDHQASTSAGWSPFRAALLHLFERYGVPVLPVTAALRARLGLAALERDLFSADGRRYAPTESLQSAIAEIAAAFLIAGAGGRRPPSPPAETALPRSDGAVRVGLAAHVAGGQGAALGRSFLGELSIETVEIAPGGAVEIPVEGELLGLLVGVGPAQGVLSLSAGENTPPKLSRRDHSCRAEADGVAELCLCRKSGGPMFKTETLLRVAALDRVDAARVAPVGAEAEASREGLEPAPGPIRFLAVIDRRPGTNLKTALQAADAGDRTDARSDPRG